MNIFIFGNDVKTKPIHMWGEGGGGSIFRISRFENCVAEECSDIENIDFTKHRIFE